MRKILVMMAVGVALLATAPAAEAHWRNGYLAGGNVVVVRPLSALPSTAGAIPTGAGTTAATTALPLRVRLSAGRLHRSPAPGVYAPPRLGAGRAPRPTFSER